MASLLRPSRRSLAATTSLLPSTDLLSPCASSYACSSSSSFARSRSFSSSPTTLAKSRPGEGKNAAKVARRRERQLKVAQDPSATSKRHLEYPLSEAYRLLKSVEVTRPYNAFEIHIKTGISSHQTNALRGRISFPFSPALKPPTLLIFAEDGSPAADAAKAAQANGVPITVGGAELIQAVSENRVENYDKVLASPEIMSAVSKSLARSLGPRGLMPNVKRGTVASSEEDMKKAIDEAIGGTDWRGDKQAVIRVAIGRLHFTESQLRSNIFSMLTSVLQRATSGLSGGGSTAKASQEASGFKMPKRIEGTPAPPDLVKRAKAVIKGMHLSSTQGPGMKIELADVL